MKYVSVSEMQLIEKEADSKNLSYDQMMQNAGKGLSEVILSKFVEESNKTVVGLVGSGNNGGDTLVALSDMAQNGWRVSAVLMKPREEGDPLLESLVKLGGEIIDIQEDKNFKKTDDVVSKSSVLLDGVLGTGIKLPLKTDLAKKLKHFSDDQKLPFVVAVDCPSGINCDTGETAPESISADLTVTMAAVKKGLLQLPAFEKIGKLTVVEIGLPDNLPAYKKINRYVIDQQAVQGVLPERPLDAHKGTFGTSLIVAGSINYTGAAYLAAKAAYRSGAGLVQLAVPRHVYESLAGVIPEATWMLLPDDMGVIDANAVEVLTSNLEKIDAMLLGPGWGQENTTYNFLSNLLGENYSQKSKSSIGFVVNPEKAETERNLKLPPLVVDADGLNLLAKIPDWYKKLPGTAILTPHPGEMSRLTGIDIQELQKYRLEAAEKYSKKWKQVVVLKGAITVIASPDGHTAVIPVASPALARAGSGDVLSGIIVGLRTQGLAPFQAAWAGAWIHAQAGKEANNMIGHSAAVVAGDILDAIPRVMCKFLG